MANDKGEKAAAYAKKVATMSDNDLAYKELSKEMCWDAVVVCAYKSETIEESEYKKLYGQITADQYSAFLGGEGKIAGSADAMKAVPEGSFLAFINTADNNKLVHAMIATGGGYAAGNKNECIGIGKPVGWEVLDLAGKLDWQQGSNCFSDSQKRPIEIHYREL